MAFACAVFAIPLQQQYRYMKKFHIVLLILAVAAISGMSFFIKDLTTYETFASAQENNNKFVVVKVQLDKSMPDRIRPCKEPEPYHVLRY
jgi:cytochrome c-type biogenesis protein CcmE